jgi:hypothetical protein
MTTMLPTPHATGAIPATPVPPLTSTDAAVHDDAPLVPRLLSWGLIIIGLSIVWLAGLTGLWFAAFIGAAFLTFPTIVNRWFAWAEARYERIATEAELAEIAGA